ncbi:MAG: hypothetical protein FWG87_08540 [Defluviitaleaceae bacterium]|nr:hypothetical protein [Defluviitaleaceae bacterium]
MYAQNKARLGVIISLLVLVFVLNGCVLDDVNLTDLADEPQDLIEIAETESLHDFTLDTEAKPTLAELLEQGRIDELTLTIYYRHIGVVDFNFTPRPLEHLINHYDYTITLSAERLQEHFDLIYEIASAEAIPIEDETDVMNARIYYVFEHERYGEIFEFFASGHVVEESRGRTVVFVNGNAIAYSCIYIDFAYIFFPELLPEDYSERFYELWKPWNHSDHFHFPDPADTPTPPTEPFDSTAKGVITEDIFFGDVAMSRIFAEPFVDIFGVPVSAWEAHFYYEDFIISYFETEDMEQGVADQLVTLAPIVNQFKINGISLDMTQAEIISTFGDPEWFDVNAGVYSFPEDVRHLRYRIAAPETEYMLSFSFEDMNDKTAVSAISIYRRD